MENLISITKEKVKIFERKLFIKKIRQEIIENAKYGGREQRIRLLAYGFIKEKPYGTMEAKINEDNLDSEIGKNTVYSYLAYLISRYLCLNIFGLKRLSSSESPEFILREHIHNWMKVRYLSGTPKMEAAE